MSEAGVGQEIFNMEDIVEDLYFILKICISFRIHTCKYRLKWRQKMVRFKILINNSETPLIKKFL